MILASNPTYLSKRNKRICPQKTCNHYTLIRVAKIWNTDDVEQQELSFIADGKAKCTVTLKESWVVSYKTNHTIQSSDCAPWYLWIPKWIGNLCLHRNLHKNVYSSLIYNCQTWKQPRWPSVSKWINKLWYIQTMEYYSVLKRNELSSHEETWRNLKCILLSERSQSKQATYCKIPTIWHLGKGKTMEIVERSVVARHWGGRDE